MIIRPVIIGVDCGSTADATVVMRLLDSQAVEVLYITADSTQTCNGTSDTILDVLVGPGATSFGLGDLREVYADLKWAKALTRPERVEAYPLPPYRRPAMHVMHNFPHICIRRLCKHSAARRDRRRRRRTRWLAELRP